LSLVLLRRYGRALQRIEQLEQRAEDDVRLFVGEPVPPFALDTAAGGELTLGGLLASGRPLVLVFTDLRCGACSALYPVVAGWQEELRELATVVVVASGEEEGVRAIAQEHGLDLERVLLGEWGLIRAYALDATPAALLLDRDGRVTVEAVYGADAIVELVADAFVLDNPAAAHV
jgi:hypothetical protein